MSPQGRGTGDANDNPVNSSVDPITYCKALSQAADCDLNSSSGRILRCGSQSMWYRLGQVSDGIERAINNMDSQQWIVISVIAILLGAVFLRGFGSRSNY